ncbi:Fic family protein [Crassaminicella profunda]|uniref:Fic family protein n=1 Tax=Crassaminicella profunda TaxID=1286698 RepID=UPI001CA643FC|nr:DNA-binding protein [Crassaminicella profunda]QZY54405.1 Fic family protein [Crassaminicella profunda]
MKYLTIKEVAQNWNISERRIRTLCSDGRIEGAKRMGWMWSIPANALKPIDARTTRHKSKLKVRCLHMNFKIIDSKKQQLDDARPLSKHTLHSLRENMFVEWTYNSNAIEGNTLTISETKVVLEGITIGGKSMREHLEVINHKAAILFLEDLIKQNEPLSEWSIKNIHGLVLKSIDDENAGSYRKENVLISGTKHKPPQHFIVKEQMEELVSLYNEKWNSLHPIERAAMLHGEFVKIHPFIDGNGRTARLLMNFELMKSGFPPTIIKANMRPQYYDHLDFAHTSGDYRSFVTLVAKCVEESLDLWLSIV